MYHPDINPSGQEHFKTVVKAYEILCDNYKKSQYDLRLKSYLNNAHKNLNTDKDKQTKNYDVSEAELKRRQYYQEHYKKQYEQTQQKTETVELKRSNNEFKNIIIATPLAVLLILLVLNVWNDKPQIKVVPYKEEKRIKLPVEKERKRVTTGDTPYADYFGGARKDTVYKGVMKFKNMCGNDLILFLFNRNNFIRSCYVEHGFEVSIELLPKEISLMRIMQGKNFEYIKELSKAGVFGAFNDSCRFYQYRKKIKLNGSNSLTILNFVQQGFIEVGEENFFKKDG